MEKNPLRAVAEWILRAVLLVALATAVWIAIRTLRERPSVAATGGSEQIRAALTRWSTMETPRQAHVVLDSVPVPSVRDWLAALRRTGTALRWEGRRLQPVAISVEPVADPARPLRVWMAAGQGAHIALNDSLGLIDSVGVRGGGALVTVADPVGALRASANGTDATSFARDSIVLKPLLLLGVAGWEAKFVMAALEEHGWRVDGRFALAPTGDVVQGGGGLTIDTSSYSAVIVIDTLAARYANQLREFVRRGGGLIVSGEAASLRSIAPLLPASTGPALPEGLFDADSLRPQRALGLTPLRALKADAIAIERSDDLVTIAARRVGQGRVLQVGYLNTWRWRLGGPEDDPVQAHRAWWAAMVSSVAYAARPVIAQNAMQNPAPLASLVDTLGSAAPRSAVQASSLAGVPVLAVLFATMLLALFLETTSRRLRGNR